MSWSFEVSMGFSLYEALCIGLIMLRAVQSDHPYIRGQLYLIPFLVTILLQEMCEGLLWLDKDEMVSITDVATEEGGVSLSKPCSQYNNKITMFMFLIIGSCQPFWLMFPSRRVGPEMNRDLMHVPEGMAMWHGAMVCYARWCYLFQVSYGWSKEWNPLEGHPYRSDIQFHNYQTYINSETCTYLGRNGLLFHTFATTDSWMTTNASSFMLAIFSIVYARPYRFSSGFLLLLGFIQFMFVNIYRTSESNMLWCFNGVLMSTYYVLQPYVFPIPPEEYDYDKSPDSLIQITSDLKNRIESFSSEWLSSSNRPKTE